MGVNSETTKAPKPVPGGWYQIRLTSGTIKKSKSGKGYNYEFGGKIVNNKAELNDKPIFFRANNGFNQGHDLVDLSHGCGFVMEMYEENGQKQEAIPGDWKLKDALKSDDFDGAQYSGPLLGKTFDAEIITYIYEGEERNDVKQIKCQIKDCATRFPDIKHRTDRTSKR